MWNLKDSSVRVGVFMKVESFQKHLTNIKNAKSELNMNKTRPWRPTFTLSQSKNRYNKNKSTQIDHENEHLFKKIVNIESKPKIKTVINVPNYIPSNKQNYQMFKFRQRQSKSRQISRQNLSISIKIGSAQKSYNRKQFQNDWRTSRVYKRNISKKHQFYDYRKLAESRMAKFSQSRPVDFRKSTNTHFQTGNNCDSQKFSNNSSMIVYNRPQEEKKIGRRRSSKFKKVQ